MAPSMEMASRKWAPVSAARNATRWTLRYASILVAPFLMRASMTNSA